MKHLFKVALTTATIPLTWGLLTTESLAASFNVTIGDSSFQINAFSDTDKILSELYDYSDFEYDGTGNGILDRSELSPGTTHFFFVEARDGLGLFMIHDQPGDDATGGQIRTVFNTVNSKGDFEALDDPIDQYTIDTTIGSTASSELTAFVGWLNPFTDGVALKWDFFGSNPSLTAKFDRFDQINLPIGDWDVEFLTNAGNNTAFKREFDFVLNQDITFTPVSTSSALSANNEIETFDSEFTTQDDVGITQTPEPSAVLGLFLISGLGGLVSRQKA